MGRGHCPQVGLPPDAAGDGRSRHHGGGRWNRTDVLLTAFAERLVRESNPSHSVDSGAATPVASRGFFFASPAGVDSNCTESTKWTEYSENHGAKRSEPAWSGLGNRRLIPSATRTAGWRTGIEPASADSQSATVPDGKRHHIDRHDERGDGGLSWTRTTFFRAKAGRYHSTSSQPLVLPAGLEPGILRLKAGDPDR